MIEETFTTEAERRLLQQCKNSVACDNEESGTGGKGADTSDEIKENALANFGSQNRAVTRKDYQVRALIITMQSMVELQKHIVHQTEN